jgi:general L-amino acid transport system substrate-binding protein
MARIAPARIGFVAGNEEASMLNRCRKQISFAITFAAISVGLCHAADAQSTVDAVRKRGVLVCGVSEGLEGFSEKSLLGGWSGFDTDFCRAVAVAVLGDANKTKFVPLSATKRFDALTSGEIDVLSRNTTWTMEREVELDIDFVGASYIDVQGIMVPRNSGIEHAAQLKNKTICVLKGTTLEENLRSFLRKNRISANLLFVSSRRKLRQAYEGSSCDAYSSDVSALVSEQKELSDPSNHIFLPEYVSKEPLGPVVRNSDPQWREIVQLVLFLLINAEEVEWTATQAKTANLTPKIDIPEGINKSLKLQSGWHRAVISQIGNYGEIFERNLGEGSTLGLSRGLNALWLEGGALMAPPIR